MGLNHGHFQVSGKDKDDKIIMTLNILYINYEKNMEVVRGRAGALDPKPTYTHGYRHEVVSWFISHMRLLRVIHEFLLFIVSVSCYL